MYCLRVYYHGPQTNWMGKVAEREVILMRLVPWLWLAKRLARSYTRDLNMGRCGYAITRDHDLIEQRDALTPSEA